MIKQIASLAVKGRCFSDEKAFCFFPKTDTDIPLNNIQIIPGVL